MLLFNPNPAIVKGPGPGQWAREHGIKPERRGTNIEGMIDLYRTPEMICFYWNAGVWGRGREFGDIFKKHKLVLSSLMNNRTSI